MFGGHGAKKGMVGRQARTEKADTTWPIFQDSGLAGEGQTYSQAFSRWRKVDRSCYQVLGMRSDLSMLSTEDRINQCFPFRMPVYITGYFQEHVPTPPLQCLSVMSTLVISQGREGP